MRKSALRSGIVALGVLNSFGAFAMSKVLFSNISTSSTSDIPSFTGVRFAAVGNGIRPFYRPFASPDGMWWIMKSQGGLLAAEDELIIRGRGLNGLGAATMLQESHASVLAGFNWGSPRVIMGIDNAGKFAFAADTTAAATTDDVVARYNGTSYDLIAREGTSGPGMAATVGYGTTNDSVSMGDAGAVSFRSAALAGTNSSQALMRCTAPTLGAMWAFTTLTLPTAQVEPAQTVDTFVADQFVSSRDGDNYLYTANLNGATATNAVVVRNGAVVAQKGLVLPNSGYTSLIASFNVSDGMLNLSPNGQHYAFRGANADNADWIYGDGAVLAKKGAPITTGATELYSDTRFANCFFANCVNDRGDKLIGGYTSNSVATRDSVLVLNDTVVVAREGDAVDLNGNGLADDNAFISVFGSGGTPARDDDVCLTSDRKVYFVVQLKNGANQALGIALLVALADPVPFSYTVVEGTQFSGGVYDLQASDDQYVKIFPDDTTLGVTVEFNSSQTVLNPSELDFSLESQVARTGIAQSIDLFDYDANDWVNVSGSEATTVDSIAEAQMTNSAGSFVDATGNLRARAQWFPINDEAPSQDGWLHSIDQVRWEVTP